MIDRRGIISVMVTVALTGNIGMGKSHVLQAFEELGVFVVNSDRIVAELLDRPEVVENVKLLLGETVVDESGVLVKSKIADIIEHSNQFIAEKVPNCIIAGTKKALIDREVAAKSLDEDGILHDNKTTMYVRQEIYSLARETIEKFASSLTESINEILEEI